MNVESLVPHQGAMCLWQRVIAHDASHARVATDNHRAPDHPLRSDGMLKAIHLCEYGAQAMAVHGGLLARARGGVVKAGVLVALRGVQLHVARIDNLEGELIGVAELLMYSDSSQQYGFRILNGGKVIADGRAAVMLGEDE